MNKLILVPYEVVRSGAFLACRKELTQQTFVTVVYCYYLGLPDFLRKKCRDFSRSIKKKVIASQVIDLRIKTISAQRSSSKCKN